MIEKLELVTDTGPVLTLYGSGVAPENKDKILTSVTGWETIDRKFDTVDRLIGPGEYLVSSHVGARSVQIDGMLFDTEVNREVARSLTSMVLHGTTVTIVRTFTVDGETTTESISGIGSSVREQSFNYAGTPTLGFSVAFLCLDPQIVVA